MTNPLEPDRHTENVILLAAFALFLFTSPVIYWWASTDSPWYTPYLLWLVVILLGAWIQHRRSRHDA